MRGAREQKRKASKANTSWGEKMRKRKRKRKEIEKRRGESRDRDTFIDHTTSL